MMRLTFRARTCGVFLLLLTTLALSGCRTVPPMPPVNLQEPDWTVREGQAVWRLKNGHEVAGEILMATRPDGREYVQFTKNPFPLAVAQATPHAWQVELPIENKRYSGHGRPPARLIFLYLPRVLAGQPPPHGWTWQRLPDNSWRLDNRASGEMLEGYINQ